MRNWKFWAFIGCLVLAGLVLAGLRLGWFEGGTGGGSAAQVALPSKTPPSVPGKGKAGKAPQPTTPVGLTKADLAGLATKGDLANLARKGDLSNLATKGDVNGVKTAVENQAGKTREVVSEQGGRIVGHINEAHTKTQGVVREEHVKTREACAKCPPGKRLRPGKRRLVKTPPRSEQPTDGESDENGGGEGDDSAGNGEDGDSGESEEPAAEIIWSGPGGFGKTPRCQGERCRYTKLRPRAEKAVAADTEGGGS